MWTYCEIEKGTQHTYSYGRLWVIAGYKWGYTLYKWGYKYLQLVKGHNCILWLVEYDHFTDMTWIPYKIVQWAYDESLFME